MNARPKVLLVVEDNPGDVRLIKEALKQSPVDLLVQVATDGYQVLEDMSLWRQDGPLQKPDLILLDLNLPRLSGQELLTVLKDNHSSKRIPVVIFTSSAAEEDILDLYQSHANCYITKPLELEKYLEVVHTTIDFWLKKASLPTVCPQL